MKVFPSPTERDRVRFEFLRWLCQERNAVGLAKQVARLADDQFDSLCALAKAGYSGSILGDRVVLNLGSPRDE